MKFDVDAFKRAVTPMSAEESRAHMQSLVADHPPRDGYISEEIDLFDDMKKQLLPAENK